MPRRFEYLGFKVVVDRNVYDPSSDTFLLAEAILSQYEVDRVIDLGSGCGLLSLIATRIADEVYSYDTSVYSYRNTIKNVRINMLTDRVHVLLGDGLDAPMADLIIINPPYIPCGPLYKQDALSASWNGGPDGLRLTLNMIEIACRKIKKGGIILIVYSSLQNSSLFFRALEAKNLRCSLIGSKSGFYERIEVYKCIRV